MSAALLWILPLGLFLGLPAVTQAAAPVLKPNQVLLVPFDSTNGTTVGHVELADTNTVSLPVTFRIDSGNTPNAFDLQICPTNAFAGQLTLTNKAALTLTNRWHLQVAVSNAQGGNTNLVMVQAIANQFSVAENSPSGTVVGRIAVGADGSSSLRFAVDTNAPGMAEAVATFDIQAGGTIIVTNSFYLDFELRPNLTLVVKVDHQDEPNPPVNFTRGTITINVTNVNEAPVLPNQAFTLPSEYAETFIGQIAAYDPENDPLLLEITELRNSTGEPIAYAELFEIRGNELHLKQPGLTAPENSVLTIRVTEQRADGLTALSAVGFVTNLPPVARSGAPLLVDVKGATNAYGLPIQAVATGPNGEVYVVGFDTNQFGYLDIYSLGLSSPATKRVAFHAAFKPTALVIESTNVYVGGHWGGPETAATVVRCSADGEILVATNWPGKLYDITDMLVENGVIYICGAANYGSGRNLMQPYWAEVDGITLELKTEPNLIPIHYPVAGSMANWGMATAIAKRKGYPDVYVAGYNNYQMDDVPDYAWCSPGFPFAIRPFIAAYRSGVIASVTDNFICRFDYYPYGAFVKDLVVAEPSGGGVYVYALEEFWGLDLPSTTTEWSTPDPSLGRLGQDVVIKRFGPDLMPTAQNASLYIRGRGLEQAESLILVPEADGDALYVTGVLPRGETTIGGTTLPPLPDPRYFVAKLNLDLQMSPNWSPPLLLVKENYKPVGGIQPPPLLSHFRPPIVPCSRVLPYPSKDGIILAGNLSSGDLVLSQAGFVNSVKVPPGQNLGFLTVVKHDKTFEIPLFLEVRSQFGLSEKHVQPHRGIRVAEPGKTYTVKVSPVLYVRANGSYLGVDHDPTPEEIEQDAVTRYVCTGYTVENTEIIGDSSSYTFIFQANTVITFHWTVEHALDIRADLTGTGAHTNDNGGYTRDADSNLGLTSLASGNPEPVVKKHWVKEDELVTAFIDGITLDMSAYGNRYVVTGYVATGSAVTSTSQPKPSSVTYAFPAVQSRQQIRQFTLRGPAGIKYLWGIQHRVQVSTSTLESQDWPGIKVVDDPSQPDRTGSGEFWFNRDTELMIGARQVHGSLKGALLVMGDLPTDCLTLANNCFPQTFTIEPNSDYRGARVLSLSKGTTVAWDYGNRLFPQTVTIGNAVDLPAAINDPALVALLITNEAPAVQVLDSPPGSTGPDMFEWDAVMRLPYPVRPGRFLLHYTNRTDLNKVGATLDITSQFPAAAHYTHLTHPELPAVQLEPDPNDATAFVKLEYTTGNASANGSEFTATQSGTNVLLFSHSKSNAVPFVPASGNRLKETLSVRVVATHQWDEPPLGLNTTNLPAPSPATIGTKVTSTHDTAGIGTGFIVYTNARYNPYIYDRTKVADAGPIIPVNLLIKLAGEEAQLSNQDLVIVWYEKPEYGILWPYRTERFDPQWPVALDPAALPNPLPDVETMWSNGINYLRRIVVASRLGSEGKDQALRNQLSFALPRFEQVTVYHQPNRNRPGYNPNEEHALVAPSFKYLDQANPPPVAYALRNDYNRTNHDATYTSDPCVLVQYLDHGINGGPGEFKMAVYAVEKEDDRFDYAHPDRPENTNDTREFPYVFHYKMKAGEPVQPPYPLGLVIGLTPCTQTRGENITAARVYWEDYRGQPWAASAGSFRSFFYYPRLDMFWVTNDAAMPQGACLEFDTAGEVFFTSQMPNPSFIQGSTFTVNGVEITLDGIDAAAFAQAVNDEAIDSHVIALVSEEGPIRLQAVGIDRIHVLDGENLPLNRAGFDTSVLAVGRVRNPEFVATDQFAITTPMGTTDITVNGTNAQAFADAVNKSGSGVGATVYSSGEIELRSAVFSQITLADGDGNPLDKAGLPTGLIGHEVAPTRAVQYTAVWPDVVPILKAGETLTFAGGEYKADNPGPETPGLPGVIGWAAGQVVYDSLNPTMHNWVAFQNYTVRLISPLEERQVELTAAQATALNDAFQPAKGLTQVMGTRWYFTKLPASLSKRIFYDPINRRLGIKGFLNDKTLGDSTLTATPPPVYVLEPNILTPSESNTLSRVVDLPEWQNAVRALYALSRNPARLYQNSPNSADAAAYYTGLEWDVAQENNQDKFTNGHPVLIPRRVRPQQGLGPGLALVPSPLFLDPANAIGDSYVTLVENNDPNLGGPISLFIVKVSKQFRYRGAIKTILSDNVFDERITLRHSGDFGANVDDLVYQWFYREEDGTATAVLPPGSPWRIFPDQSDSDTRGRGMYQINLEGTGGLLLSDNLFFVRYRHKNDQPAAGRNSTDWTGTEWDRYGRFNRDENNKPVHKVGTHWAGAANSPTVDGAYKPQLAMGWIKRVLDRVNPYEARISDFRNNGAPATYASMIQQFGQRYEGPVALNPDKNVIENVGLIELYETLLTRGRALSIDLSSPVTTPGINTALQLAATRVSDFYMLLGNEAYGDAQAPTIGYGNDNIDFLGDYGSMASSMFAFQNQVGSLLDEELALLRGVPESYGRPVYNRLFWNFTKSLGEVAYVMSYDITDYNRDGFIDEFDALALFPQGHGDAWGHYLTAVKAQYRLLQHPYYNWVSRAEQYNLLDVVINVDYLDERRFAEAAAARAKAGAEIVNLTYRARYVDDPDGQWQGYADTDTDRAWGVDGWARRAGQGALLDWLTANALIPSKDTNLEHNALQKIDRSTVTAIQTLSSQLGEIQSEYDNANNGLNPLGLAADVVPFDIDATFNAVGSTAQIGRPAVQGLTHFKQIYERAVTAVNNARAAFDNANVAQTRQRQVTESVDSFRQEAIEQDLDFRNRLIEVFGTPYEGAIGAGKPYPAGYYGPDLMLWMYVDVNDVSSETVPASFTSDVTAWVNGFKQQILAANGGGTEDFTNIISTWFVSDLSTATNVGLLDLQTNKILVISNLPIVASGYAFRAPTRWGRRASPGELQLAISDLVQAEADLELAVGDYWAQLRLIQDMADLLVAKHAAAASTIKEKKDLYDLIATLNALIRVGKFAAENLFQAAHKADKTVERTANGMKVIIGAASTPANSLAETIKLGALNVETLLRSLGLIGAIAAEAMEASKEPEQILTDIEIAKAAFAYELREKLKELEQALRQERLLRLEAFKRLEALRQTSDRYRASLEAGLRLLQDRQVFNIKSAGVVQRYRYQDMAFRVFRNDALQKYRAAFDLAARYTYMAAKAYDYETSLSPDDRGSAQPILTEIVRARTLGVLQDGEPVLGGMGLADELATLRDNYRVLEGRMSFNNPQFEHELISLRTELFRINPASTNDAHWRQTLKQYRVADLWQVPEFRRYCRPPAPRSAGPLPGLIIPFGTEIVFSRNVFGWPLGPGDHAYDPSVFATKIQSAAVYFQNYKLENLAATPRVYLVPAGLDVMTIPTSQELATREWTIVDQAIPVPYRTSSNDLANPNWIPAYDSLSEPFGQIRRFSSFLAKDLAEFDPGADALSYDTRLIARSVWNTRWLLIIPGGHLLADGEDGLDTFIDGAGVPGGSPARDLDGIKDIKLLFHTYGYSGN